MGGTGGAQANNTDTRNISILFRNADDAAILCTAPKHNLNYRKATETNHQIFLASHSQVNPEIL